MASITELEPTPTGPEALGPGRGVGRVEVGNPSAAAALAHAQVAMDELFAAGVGPDDARDAVVWIDELERLGRRVDAARSELVGSIQRRVLHTADGHGSAKIMVRHVAHLSEAEALARAKTARLAGDVPKVTAAWRAGEVSTCAVRTLGRVDANPRVAAAMRARDDEFLSDAQTMGAKMFAHKVHRWARLIDEDGPEPANERNHKKRDARLVQNPWDLSWELTGFFASAQGAELREILDRYVDAEFEADWAEAKARLGPDGLFGDGITKHDLQRTDAQRRADALVRVFRDAAAADGSAIPPGWVHNIHWSAGAYEEMLAAMEADRQPRFVPDTFMCRTSDGHDVDPTEAAANSLLHKVRRVIVDAAGVVIDLGRARRFTGSARVAATAGHTHCIWPGCHAPASRCEIDHLHEHGRGGTTSPSNSAPLCGKHNRWKQKGFTIQRDPTGGWHTARPDGSQLE
ncbi:MAG: DUF222 domain-containing protein [Candidatus Microthrix subdominans]